jgi:hypothetical protein
MRNSKFYIVYTFCIAMLGWTSMASAQTISKTLNVQGVLKNVSGGTLTGSYGMRFTFKKNSAAFTTPCVVTKSSVTVVNGVFNAAVSTSACNLANEISNTTAATITVDIEVDTASGGAFSSAAATFSGITVNPVAMSLVAERANGLLVTGTSGQVLTYNGSTWAAATPSSGAAVSSVAGRSGAVTLTTADISGLGSAAMLNTSAVFQTANNLSELAASPSAARTNLGLGSLAVMSPSGSASSTTYLRGDGSWATAPTAPVTSVAGRTGIITLSTSDISGLGSLATISPSGSASSSTYLRGDGTWATAPGAPVTSVAGRTGIITLGTIDIAGLGSASALASSEVLQTANNLSELTGSASTARTNISAAAKGANSDITSLSGLTTALSIGQGGTGSTTKTAAFDSLSPAAAKGNILVHNGTNNVALTVGTDKQILAADSSQASGVKWVNNLGIGFSSYIGATNTSAPGKRYFAPGIATLGATENTKQLIAPATGYIRNLYVRITSAQSATGAMTFTVRTAPTATGTGVSSSVTCTIAANAAINTTCSDTTNSVLITEGDLISIESNNLATATSATIGQVSFVLTPQ